MLSRIRQWITEVRAKRETHALAWHAAIQPKLTGCLSFQRMAAAALVVGDSSHFANSSWPERGVSHCSIPGSNAEVLIYYSSGPGRRQP